MNIKYEYNGLISNSYYYVITVKFLCNKAKSVKSSIGMNVNVYINNTIFPNITEIWPL